MCYSILAAYSFLSFSLVPFTSDKEGACEQGGGGENKSVAGGGIKIYSRSMATHKSYAPLPSLPLFALPYPLRPSKDKS